MYIPLLFMKKILQLFTLYISFIFSYTCLSYSYVTWNGIRGLWYVGVDSCVGYVGVNVGYSLDMGVNRWTGWI
jgi:hypothetical protein